MKTILFTLAFVWLTDVAAAEPSSPYLGQHTRQIKALSAAEVAGYLQGQGMGLAKAAELNHYPGPRHVLDLGERLGLSDSQRQKTRALFDDMKAQAVDLGKRLVDKERELDSMFADGEIDSNRLKAVLDEVGVLQVRLRFVHLNAHLKQKALLTKHQVMLYDRERGYASHAGHHHGHSHSH